MAASFICTQFNNNPRHRIMESNICLSLDLCAACTCTCTPKTGVTKLIISD